MEIKKIYLNDDVVKKLEGCEIGRGTDGAVYKTKQGIIKIYHSSFQKITSALTINDDSDMKIYIPNNKTKTNNDDILTYYQNDGEHIRIRNNFAIEQAIERQKHITRTNLPQGLVYYKNLFVGCILKEVKGIQIHKLTGLPFKRKKKIIKNVILDVKELIDCCVYHTDLDNSPFSETSHLKLNGVIESVGHSHVLVNPQTCKTHLIDLEGKSTVYTDEKDPYYEALSLASLIDLIIEFLLEIDLNKYKDNDETDIDSLKYDLTNLGIIKEYIEGLANRTLNMEQIESFVDETPKIKTL